MKLNISIATLTIGMAASFVTSATQAQDACASFLCMAGKVQGKSSVPGCIAPVQAFFSPTLYVYDNQGINWPATAVRRAQFLAKCPGSFGENSGIFANIIARYGTAASG